jgi:hypothetical protein
VLLEGHQIIERVDPVEFAGVDEAHVNVADSGWQTSKWVKVP